MSQEKELVTKPKLLNSNRSMFRRYQELAVGRYSLLSLLKYELLTIPFSGLSGALGYYLRSRFARHLFDKVGSNVIFGNNISLYSPHKIRLGNNVAVSGNCRLDVKGDGNTNLSIGNNVLIGANTIMRCRFGGTLEIGNNTGIGDNCIVASRDTSVKIGDKVLMAAYCYIMGGPGHNIERADIPIDDQPLTPSKGLVIEDDVWLGAGVKVLDGVKIGRGSVIGAGAVVTENIPEFSIAVGIPAKVIRKRK